MRSRMVAPMPRLTPDLVHSATMNGTFRWRVVAYTRTQQHFLVVPGSLETADAATAILWRLDASVVGLSRGAFLFLPPFGHAFQE